MKDRAKADKAAVEATRGIITVVEAGGQFQVVVGNAVGKVYESLIEKPGVSAGTGGGQGGVLSKAIELAAAGRTAEVLR